MVSEKTKMPKLIFLSFVQDALFIGSIGHGAFLVK